MKRTILSALLVALTALGLGACGGDDTAAETRASATATEAPAVEVSDPWARASAKMQNAGALYMTLKSGGGDTLTGVSVPASVAAEAQLHETKMSDSSTSEGMDTHGDTHGAVAEMKEVHSLELPAGESMALKPGGHHIMLMKLSGPLEPGDKVPVTLAFEKAGPVTVDAVVREG